MLEILIVIAKHKLFLFKCLLVGILMAVLIAVFLPKKYEATTRIMPPQQSQSIATAMLNQLGPLAALAGKDVGLHSNSDLYIALLKSRTIADDLITKFSLMQVYGQKNLVDTRKRLEEQTEIQAGKEGVISVAVRDRVPERAASLSNGYVEELRQLTQTLAVTEAGRRLESMLRRFGCQPRLYPRLAPGVTHAEVRRTINRLRSGAIHSTEPGIPSHVLANLLEGAIAQDTLIREVAAEMDELTALERRLGKRSR